MDTGGSAASSTSHSGRGPIAASRLGVTLAGVRRAGLIAAGVVGVVVLGGLGAWLALFRDTAEPVTVADAITSFRTETEGSVSASPIPPGVYVYSTDGSGERALLQELADRWTTTLREHTEHWAAVYPMTWRTAS